MMPLDVQSIRSETAPKVRHSDLSPVMMIGHGSSGTSILAELMRKYLQIAFGTESQFIIHYYRRLNRYGDLNDPRNLQLLLRDIATERWFVRGKKFGYQVDADALCRSVRERTYRGVLNAIFEQFAGSLGMCRWGDKTPEYVHHLDVVGELFPDARYVHMVRDGRDVANSVMGRYWGAKNVYVAAREWVEGVALVDAFVAGLPPGRVIEVSYEQLLEQPISVFSRLMEFLGIDDSEGAVRDYIKRHVDQDLNRDNFNKWRQWPEAERIRFERIACDLLQRHGYETVVPAVDDSFSLPERCYWQLHNKFWKWTYPRYVRDNFYRAKLRLVDAWRGLRSKGSK